MKGSGLCFTSYADARNEAVKHVRNRSGNTDGHTALWNKIQDSHKYGLTMPDMVFAQSTTQEDAGDSRSFLIYCPQCQCRGPGKEKKYLGCRIGFHAAHFKLLNHLNDGYHNDTLADRDLMKKLASRTTEYIVEDGAATVPAKDKAGKEAERKMVTLSNIDTSTSIEAVHDFQGLPGHSDPKRFRLFYDEGKVYGFADLTADHAEAAVKKLHQKQLGSRRVSVQLACEEERCAKKP